MTDAEKIMVRGLEDAISSFGLLEATLRQGSMEPLAEIVRQMKIKASVALAQSSRSVQQ